MTKQDVINALGDRPSADELRKMDDTRIDPEADEEFTASDWLKMAFVWRETPQGFDYWKHEYMMLYQMDKLAGRIRW